MARRRGTLERDWMVLTRDRMPRAARAMGWPVHEDHCFQRILLDNACGGVWYDHIIGRPAYACASDRQLAGAIALGEAALAGEADLAALNALSLAWRRTRSG
jgi:hypothetical protein